MFTSYTIVIQFCIVCYNITNIHHTLESLTCIPKIYIMGNLNLISPICIVFSYKGLPSMLGLNLLLCTSKPVLNLCKTHYQKEHKLVSKTNYLLMQLKRIAECSKGSILQYF